jgi:putative membrane protein
MHILSKIIITLIALEHLYILWIEMFAWTSVGKKVFRGAMPPNMFEATRVLAANQGLYNGFLAAGLIWSLLIPNPIWSQNVATFFLACVAIAGIYGSITAAKSIFFVQALPAIIGLIIVLMSNN